jgi:hypothetical protein
VWRLLHRRPQSRPSRSHKFGEETIARAQRRDHRNGSQSAAADLAHRGDASTSHPWLVLVRWGQLDANHHNGDRGGDWYGQLRRLLGGIGRRSCRRIILPERFSRQVRANL